MSLAGRDGRPDVLVTDGYSYCIAGKSGSLPRPPGVMSRTFQIGQIECVKHDAWGTPGQPFSRQDCWRKFLALTAPILGYERAADLGHTLLDLATVPDVAGIVGLMADPRGLTPGKPRVTI